MKTRRSVVGLIGVACVWCWSASLQSAYVEEDLSLEHFHDSLDSYGEWVDVGNYGAAWHPTQVDDDWSPYSNGSWAYSDDGWTWMGEEPWADTVFHYGRWTYVDGYGWCWVPGYDWAPAWVSWRDSDDFVGWAPLPPEADWDPEVGLGVWVDSYYPIGPRFYHFLHARDMAEPALGRAYLPWRHNLAFMLATSNVTHVMYNKLDHHVFSGGPNLAQVSQITSRPIPRYHLVDDPAAKQSTVAGEDLHVFRPSAAKKAVAFSGTQAPAPRSVVRELAQSRVSRGWSGYADVSGDTMQRLLKNQTHGLTPQSAPVKPEARPAVQALPPTHLFGGALWQRPSGQFQEPSVETGPPAPNGVRSNVSPGGVPQTENRFLPRVEPYGRERSAPLLVPGSSGERYVTPGRAIPIPERRSESVPRAGRVIPH